MAKKVSQSSWFAQQAWNRHINKLICNFTAFRRHQIALLGVVCWDSIRDSLWLGRQCGQQYTRSVHCWCVLRVSISWTDTGMAAWQLQNPDWGSSVSVWLMLFSQFCKLWIVREHRLEISSEKLLREHLSYLTHQEQQKFQQKN